MIKIKIFALYIFKKEEKNVCLKMNKKCSFEHRSEDEHD